MMILITLLLATLVVIYAAFKTRFAYWKRRNIPYIEPTVPFGNSENIFRFRTHRGLRYKQFYDHFKATNGKHGGVFALAARLYMPADLELIKNILTKDFQHFTDKQFYINEPISHHLFAIGGEKWRTLRQKVTPTFTTGKMKMMFSILLECQKPLIKLLERLEADNDQLDAKEISARFTTDIIGSAAFGLDCNSIENPDSEFRKYGKEIFTSTTRKTFKALFSAAFSDFARFIGLTAFSKETGDFYHRIISETVKYRTENNVKRSDFLQMMMELKDKDGDSFSMDDIAAQSFVFFLAGFETSSTTVSFCMFELALHQDIQDRIRKEIADVLSKHDGQITYESLHDMVYMKQVIDETLRKYPPLPTVDRKCVKDYKIPGTDCVLEAGVGVVISTLGLHRDPDYFPDPDKFDPERFSPENVQNIQPYSYMPFGEGPRVCIGLRFGIMQTKVALITLLKDYRYTLNKKTSPNMEIGLGFTLNIKGDLLLDIEKI